MAARGIGVQRGVPSLAVRPRLATAGVGLPSRAAEPYTEDLSPQVRLLAHSCFIIYAGSVLDLDN